MDIFFITMGEFAFKNQKGIYPDLIRKLREDGHRISVLGAYNKHCGKKEDDIYVDGVRIVHTIIGNLEKCGPVEKGITMLLLDNIYINAIKKYFSNTHFDLVIYATPPITFVRTIEYIKKRDGARSYLLLKDIFPQNAVDIGILKTRGVGRILYKYFRNTEIKLYKLSDRIGCMSSANKEYILKHNKIESKKVEVFPNCISTKNIMSIDEKDKNFIKIQYNIPNDKVILVYGGNLGKPQGIPFIIDCLKSQKNNKKVFFIIIGSGTEFSKLENYIKKESPQNVLLLKAIPRDDYNKLLAVCDIGLIFLDHDFTIPNYPSRLLGYMQARLPIIACTDVNTDIGKDIINGGFGWWCESNNVHAFEMILNTAIKANLKDMGKKGFSYLLKNFSIENHYHKIIEIID